METLETYIPMDRRQALAKSTALPDHTQGAALFADISGFTPLTEALVRELGSQRGAEELTRHLNRVFDALIAELHRYGGSVIGFAGDAITCWIEGDTGLRATACALAMQRAMERFVTVTIPSGSTVSLAMKTAVATGTTRRFVVGDPQIHLIDVLAGATLDRLVAAEHQAERGEVVLDPLAIASLGDRVQVVEWRRDDETDESYGVVTGVTIPVDTAPWESIPAGAYGEEDLRPWLLPLVYERLHAGRGQFLAELRPAVVLFLRFGGINYDEDEGAGRKLNAYIRWVQSVLVDYEGYLWGITIGDKGSYLYTAFGAPIAHEDDAVRAVSAALELQRVPEELNFIESVQIGVSQGRLWAGAYGGGARRTYGVMGDDVNLAARLMQAAELGQILVCQPVRQAAGDIFAWQELPAIRVKGKTELVEVCSPSSVRRHRTFRLQKDEYALPMVGREAELALIEEKLDQALGGQGQLIGITGHAGIGKSRLLAEAVRIASGRHLTGYAGACESYGTNTSYLVWRGIWRTFFGLDPSWEEVEQVSALEKELERVDPALVPRLPLLGVALNVSIPDNDLTRTFDAELRKASLEALLVDCVRARARGMPMLFVLEDCHWLDSLSHDLLEVMGRAIADLPVLLTVAYRPPELDRVRAPRIDRLPHFTGIELTDFTPQEAERLITLKLQQFSGPQAEVPPALVERITARAEGNPFYIEELLNYLQDRGIDPRDATALERLDLPTSLHSLIISRLDQRTESQKIILRVASVIGRLFQTALLWATYPDLGAAERVKTDLEALTRLDLTRADTPEPDLAYLFKHIVTQEVAYESLPWATRAMLHEQLAGYLERTYIETGEQFVDLLAYHYERSENEAKKREYLRKAGEAAQADFANEAAIDYYQRALPLLSGAERTDVLIKLGDVLTLVGRYDEALERYAAARSLLFAQDLPALSDYVAVEAPAADRMRRLADLCTKTAEVYERRSEYDVAFEWLGKGLSYLDEEESTIEIARIYIVQAGVCYRQNRMDDAVKWCEKSLDVAKQIETRQGQQAVAQAYYNLGSFNVRRGDLQQALRFCRESVAVYQQIEDVVGQSKAYNNLGNVYASLGDWSNASDALHESLAINREVGAIQEQGFVTNNLGLIHLDRGEWAKAAALFEESTDIWKRLGATLFEAVTLSNLAQVHIYQENWFEAHTCLERSQAVFAEIGAEGFLAELERRWGEYYLKNGKLDQALAHTRRSIELAVAHEDPLEEGKSSRVLGRVHLARGERDLAEAALRQSLGILTDLNSEYEAAKTILPLVRVTSEDDPDAARAQLEGVIQIFEKLGAQADLAEAQVLAGQLES